MPTLVTSGWAIAVQVCQIFIETSGRRFTTSGPKCTGAQFGRLSKRMTSALPNCGHQKSWAISRNGRNALSSLEKGSATFGNLAELYRVRIQSDTRLKPSSKIYRCQTIDAILRFRPEWNERLIRDIRESDCLQWAANYSGKVHGTRFNNTVGTLRAFRAGPAQWTLGGQSCTIYTQGARSRKEP